MNFAREDGFMIKGVGRIEKKLVVSEAQREKVMQVSRENIRLCGKAISLMHAKKMHEAEKLVLQLKKLNSQLRSIEKGFEYYSLQAHQEYAEAMLLRSVLKKGRIASVGEVGTGDTAYLLGLMDLVGELKREALDSIRLSEIEKAERYYNIMLDIYDSTLHMRFANSLLPDFRKKQDVARIQIEGLANELSRFGARISF